jgi:superfamily II DNA/RNA helicase
VLDEADHMADLGFLPAVKRLLDATPRDAQRLLFSATLDNAIDQLVRRYLTSPVTHSVDTAASPVPAMTHHLLHVTADHKQDVVYELVGGQGRTLAFTRTKHRAKRLAKQLTAAGIPAVDLHGNLSQSARQKNLAAFSDGTSRVLVATDIAARGIHVDDVSLVVHVDPPAEHKAYLHRSGRTARAGAEGVVVTLSTPDERKDTQTLMRQAGIKPTTADVTPGHPAIKAVTGPAAERIWVAAPESAQGGATQAQGRGQARSRGRGQGGGQGRTQGGGQSRGQASGQSRGLASGQGRAEGGGQSRGQASGQSRGQTNGQGRAQGGSKPAPARGARGGRSAAPAGSSGGLAAFSAGRRGR